MHPRSGLPGRGPATFLRADRRTTLFQAVGRIPNACVVAEELMTHGSLNCQAIEDTSRINGLAVPMTFKSPGGSFEMVVSGEVATVASVAAAPPVLHRSSKRYASVPRSLVAIRRTSVHMRLDSAVIDGVCAVNGSSECWSIGGINRDAFSPVDGRAGARAVVSPAV